MEYNKIHIIGGPGSGKSFASRALSKKLSIPYYDLDDIFWDHNANDYNTKTADKVRSELLDEIIQKNNGSSKVFIIDGLMNHFKGRIL